MRTTRYAVIGALRLAGIGLTTILLSGCPPPAYVDLFNNTGERLRISMRSGSVAIDAGRSFAGNWFDVFAQRIDPRSLDPSANGPMPPILQVEYRESLLEYEWRFTGADDREWIADFTYHLQIDSDLTLRMVDPDEARPVPADRPQPMNWPVEPVVSDAWAYERSQQALPGRCVDRGIFWPDWREEEDGEPVLFGESYLSPGISFRVTLADTGQIVPEKAVRVSYVWRYPARILFGWTTAYELLQCTTDETGILALSAREVLPRGWYDGWRQVLRQPQFEHLEIGIETDRIRIRPELLNEPANGSAGDDGAMGLEERGGRYRIVAF